MTKILITGGHVTPALALMEELRGMAGMDIVFVGRTHATEGSPAPSAEYELVSAMGVRFLPITTGRLQRTLTSRTIPSLLKIPVGFWQAYAICARERPSLIVSFGGYIALPVVVAGWALGIPIVTHEQTRRAGLTNRMIAGVAKKICVTFGNTVTQFPIEKTVVTGLPMRKAIFSPPTRSPFSIQDRSRPILYITGGSVGARSLNRLLYPVMGKLTAHFTVIHQVGFGSLAEATRARQSLTPGKRARYIIEAFLNMKKLSWVLRHAALIVGRSGANTITECAALGKVALFIPLPWSGGGEQTINAKWLEHNGGVKVIDQRGLTAEKLLAEIERVWEQRQTLGARAEQFAKTVPRDGAARMAREIALLLLERV